jgi:hypothetical protein
MLRLIPSLSRSRWGRLLAATRANSTTQPWPGIRKPWRRPSVVELTRTIGATSAPLFMQLPLRAMQMLCGSCFPEGRTLKPSTTMAPAPSTWQLPTEALR